MTVTTVSIKQKNAAILLWTSILLLLIAACTAHGAVQDALQMCAQVLIPSLFPYMVLSAFIVRSGGAFFLGRPFGAVVRHLFRLPECAAGSILLGTLCGFPIGAQSACELYRRGELTKEEAERLIPLANCTGPAFVIEVVGEHFWGSRGFGILVYLIQLIAGGLIGILRARRVPIPPRQSMYTPDRPPSLLVTLSDSVRTSANAMLTICGFVVTFSAITAAIAGALHHIGADPLAALIASILEFTAGSRMAAETGGIYGAFLAGASIGWSGLSVFAQSQVFAHEAALSLRPALRMKALQGGICAIAISLLYGFTDIAGNVHCATIAFDTYPLWAFYGEIALLVLFCLFPFPPIRRKAKPGKIQNPSARD